MFAVLPPVQQFSPTFSDPSSWVPARLSPSRATAVFHFTNTTQEMASSSNQLSQPLFGSSVTTPETHKPSNQSQQANNAQNQEFTSQSSSRTRTSPLTYAQRYSSLVANPLNQSPRPYTSSSSPSARTARRNAFLNRVKQDRDKGRFENRGEQLMFMENVVEQRKWGELMRKGAEELATRLEEEVELDSVDEAEVHALDKYLEQEHALEMELLGHMDADIYPSNQPGMGNDAHVSFSDDEYDDIFMNLADPSPSQQDVDMSSG